MAKRKNMPDLALLKELVEFDPETGVFLWKVRAESMFPARRHAKMWNRRFAGKEAFNTLSHNGYLYGALFEENHSTHRLAWYYVNGVEPDEIDHINGIRNDNRIANLRNVTRLQNCQNTRRPTRNKSGVVGVTWDPKNRLWVARIKTLHIGRFKLFEDAISARKAAELEFGFHANHGR
jgi:hypothetical protein